MSEYAVYGGSVNAEGAMRPLKDLFRTGYSTGLAVSQRGAGANMSVDVSAGGGQHVTAASVSTYGWSDAVKNVTVTAANPSNPRRDIVVSYIDLALITTATTNNVGAPKFAVVAGTPAASPADPSDATIQTAIGAGNPFNKLARIQVATGATTIVNANLTDLRVPMALAVPYLYGGALNTLGHLVPNVADDTLTLLAAVQTLNNKTIGATNTVQRVALATATRSVDLNMFVRLAATTVPLFPETGTTGADWTMVVPDDYVSGDLTVKMLYRGAAAGGVVNLVRSTYRFRANTAILTIDTGVAADYSTADTNSRLYSFTVAATNFQIGDLIRVDITRNQADSSTASVEMDGIWAEYTGRA